MANTDEFGIWLSTFDDGLNAVRFSTTPDGVQVDEQLSPNNNDGNRGMPFGTWRAELTHRDGPPNSESLGWHFVFPKRLNNPGE